MFVFLNSFTQSRAAWLTLAAIATTFEIIALYFQHVLGLAPCVMCIYQRCAMLGIIAAGLLGAIAPQFLVMRICAYALWGYSAIKGYFIAVEHVGIQLSQSPFFSCDFRPNFAYTVPLDTWLPFFFKADGDCASISWSFLGWSMSQWMVTIFASFTAILILTLMLRLYYAQRQYN